ncbi:MAG TPA: oligosaccharide flippase family protein, partial [Ktedonobacterales bacterium]|nr:oligosaccharide flippase family protein [Ktedonobacterales bacterium]
MQVLRRVVNNTAISLVGQAITWTATLLLTAAYGRFLGDVKFGELYLAITFVGVIGFPIEFSFNQQLVREVAQDPTRAPNWATNTLLIKCALWSVLYGVFLALSWLLGYSGEERFLVAVCGGTLLLTSLGSTFGALHTAAQRLVYPAVGAVIEKGLDALVIILLLQRGAGVRAAALVLLGGALAGAIWQAAWFARLMGLHYAI